MLATVAALVVLKGLVTIGPLQPVCRVGTPCDGPAPRVVLTFASGTSVTRATTRSNGRYTVRLAPGTYTVTASKGMRITPAQVVIRPVTQQHQNFAIDTGIR